MTDSLRLTATNTALRLMACFVYLLHSWQKLFGMFGGIGGGPARIGSLFWAAGLIETILGLFILVGLFTRPMAFIASGEMAAAYFIGHFPHAVLPVRNGGDAPLLLCFIFLFFSVAGPGEWGLDHLLWPRRAHSVLTTNV